jgi:hypothetical protein
MSPCLQAAQLAKTAAQFAQSCDGHRDSAAMAIGDPFTEKWVDIWLVVWNMFVMFPYIGNNHPN